MRNTMMVLLAGVVVLWAGAYARGEWVWMEGEKPGASDFVKHNWYDAVEKSALAGGDWLSHYSLERAGQASYKFQLKRAGTYEIWLRGNSLLSAMDWQMDGGEWQAVDFKQAREPIHISPRPDHRMIAWVKISSAKLAAKEHTLALRTGGRKDLGHHGGIDAILITDDNAFTPVGKDKPGDAANQGGGPADWFPAVAGDDPFSDKSVIDQSAMLEKPAGKWGFLKARGPSLQFEKADRPIKFWGCTGNVDESATDAQDAQRARYLAKYGINMVRQHAVFDALGPMRQGKLDAAKLDRYDRWFARLKAQGIYVTWSVFYHHRLTAEDGYAPELLAELPEGGDTYGFVHFSETIQNSRLKYLKALLAHVNPHTKLAYKDDPALAVVEIQNEDCLFWHWPLNDLAAGKKFPQHTRLLRQAWAQWLKKKYGDDAALQKAWGTRETLAGDLRMYGAWEFAADRSAKADRRKGDFVEFLTDVQRSWYERWEREVRAAGFQGVSVATAWRAGGPAGDPANLYCDTAAGMISRHNYAGGGAGGHRIATGDVTTFSHLGRAGSGLLSSALYQVGDKPFCMTEWTQCPPNEWKSEAAPLLAFYLMGLQGMDASYHFAQDGSGIGNGWPRLGSYVTDTPAYVGQFPALAMAIRQGHIAEAPIAAARRLKKTDLFLGVDPLSQDFSGGGWDQKTLVGNVQTPAEVLAIGKATVDFDGGQSQRPDWSTYWDKDQGRVRSMTGELLWDTGKRIVQVSAPRTHAIIGFAGGGTYDLPGAKIQVKTEFVSLILTALDDQPIEQSRRILVTALARDKQSGAEYSADGKRLEKLGSAPLLLEPVQATVSLKGPPVKDVRPLDLYGVPKPGPAVERKGNDITLDGRYKACYYEILR